jgi:hypothetical protein
MVQILKRKVDIQGEERYEIDTLGVNSNNIFTILCKDGKIINFRPDEAEKIRCFLNHKYAKCKCITDAEQMPESKSPSYTVTTTGLSESTVSNNYLGYSVTDSKKRK